MKEEQSFFIREINERDQDFLFEMLYQSIFVKPGSSPSDRDILSLPEIRKYVENWGRENDFGFIAIDNESELKIGAIWLRYFDFKNKGYGYISDNIPEIGIAVDYKRRGQGIGSALLKKLLNTTTDSLETITLSVDPSNPAVKLYQKFGFKECGQSGTSIIIRYDRSENYFLQQNICAPLYSGFRHILLSLCSCKTPHILGTLYNMGGKRPLHRVTDLVWKVSVEIII